MDSLYEYGEIYNLRDKIDFYKFNNKIRNISENDQSFYGGHLKIDYANQNKIEKGIEKG